MGKRNGKLKVKVGQVVYRHVIVSTGQRDFGRALQDLGRQGQVVSQQESAGYWHRTISEEYVVTELTEQGFWMRPQGEIALAKKHVKLTGKFAGQIWRSCWTMYVHETREEADADLFRRAEWHLSQCQQRLNQAQSAMDHLRRRNELLRPAVAP